MDTHDTKTFPSDAMSASGDHGDSTAVMFAAESLGDASCPQPIYQHLVEAEVMEALERRILAHLGIPDPYPDREVANAGHG